MSNVTRQNLFTLFVLILLLQRIKGDWDFFTVESSITPRPRSVENTKSETAITTAYTVEDEKFDDHELKKLFIRNFKLFENYSRDTTRPEIQSTQECPQRKSRQVTETKKVGMECFTCSARSANSKAEENCYEGVAIPSTKCADAELCFTELNPKFIKRGCILPGRLNRTFVCKCPLCNDKPSFDVTHYEYTKLSDWEYDNARLQTPLKGMDLMCKVCETKGTNPTSDKNCRFGKNADYMVCGHNQLCYTNIDDETDFVSRGCIQKPLYNSIYFFCNTSECNNERFFSPTRHVMFRASEIKLKDEPKKLKTDSSHAANTRTIDLYLLFILTFIKCVLPL